MSTNDQILAVSVEARINKLEREMRKASAVVGKNFDGMEKRSKQAAAKIENSFAGMSGRIGKDMAASFGQVTRVLGTLGIAVGGKALLDLAGQFTDLKSRVDNAAGSMKRGNVVLDRLQAISRRTYSSLSQTAEGWLANNTALTELGYSTQQQLDLTETLNNALVISATRGDRARSVMDAWSKAMAGGKLSGDQLNTIVQSGGRLAKGLADSMGVTTAELRRLGAEGKITTDVMFGVTSQLSTLREEAERMPATVSDGFVVLGNAVLRFVGEADKAVGSSTLLAEAIVSVADAIDQVRESEWFGKLLKELGDDLGKFVATTKRELEGLGLALDYLQTHGARDVISDLFGGGAEAEADNVAGALRNVANAVGAIAGAEAGAVFDDLTERLIINRISAEDAKAEILAFGEAHPNLGSMVEQFVTLIGTLDAVRNSAIDAASAVSAIPQGPSRGRGGPRAFKTRVNLDDDGGAPITPPIETPSTPRPAGSSRAASAMREQRDAAREVIDALEDELRLLGASDTEQRVNAELRRAGAGATDAQKQSIRELVEAIDAEQQAMRRMEDTMGDARDMAKDFLGGLIGDLRNGVDGATALMNAFGRLADKLLDMALDSLISSMFSGLAGGGGLLGGIFGFKDGGVVHAATGGHVRGPGTGTSDSIPARLSDGEFVVNARATRRNLDLLHAINRGEIAAFASGGLAGDGPARRAANDNLRAANDNGSAVTINAPITVNGSAGTPEQNDDLAKKMAKQMDGAMRAIVADEIRRQKRAGNMLNSRGYL